MNSQIQSSRPNPVTAVAQTVIGTGEADQQISRIRRIGKRLFGVANCTITFNAARSLEIVKGKYAACSVEAAFCHSRPQPTGLVVVPDACEDKLLCQHCMVIGAPYIRFYASYPIHNAENEPIGSISLINYLPRAFSEEDRQMLKDLAHLVEREMHLRSMSAAQLDLQRKNKNLRRKSLIDPLLGTWNRGAIMRILSIEAIRCDKIGMPLSLIVADLDYFKKINDNHGHPAGDAVLVRIASRLRSCIREQEALGRYGGEEFLVVLPGSAVSTAMAVAERMRCAIASQPEFIAGKTLQLTISAGIASTDLFPLATTDELISRADVALYAAKDAGRNCVMQAVAD